MKPLRRVAAVVSRRGARTYKTTISPAGIAEHPEIQRDNRMVQQSLKQERQVLADEERGRPADPTAQFLFQGRQLLQNIDDGGDVVLRQDTGIPGVYCLELQNPEDDNVFTARMMCQLEDRIRELNQMPECVALIVRGIGAQFCGGASGELATRHLLGAEHGLVMSRYMQTLLLELHNLPIISVAAIEGAAISGGAEFALACDFRVMTKGSNIHFAHTHMGLTTGWGGATRLTKLVGRRAALLMLCSGKPVRPEDAIGFGLADRICDEGGAFRDAMTFVKANFLNCPAEAVKGSKDVVAAAEILPPRAALIYEQNIFSALWARNARLAGTAQSEPSKMLPSEQQRGGDSPQPGAAGA